jgi:hypothetical protein
MCLNKILYRNNYLKKKKYGWKIFKMDDNNRYFTPYEGTNKALKSGIFLDEKDYRRTTLGYPSNEGDSIITSSGVYKKGWHFYFNKKDAVGNNLFYTVKKVIVKNIHTIGKQGINNEIVGVCKYIKILK